MNYKHLSYALFIILILTIVFFKQQPKTIINTTHRETFFWNIDRPLWGYQMENSDFTEHRNTAVGQDEDSYDPKNWTYLGRGVRATMDGEPYEYGAGLEHIFISK